MTWQLRHPAPIRWDFLAGVLPHGIEPMDIDLCIERRGYFLFLEGKRPGELMPRGQERCLDALARLPHVTVMRFEGEPPEDVTGYALWGADETTPTTTERFRAVVREWFAWADREAA